jgi:hypothetical protein
MPGPRQKQRARRAQRLARKHARIARKQLRQAMAHVVLAANLKHRAKALRRRRGGSSSSGPGGILGDIGSVAGPILGGLAGLI